MWPLISPASGAPVSAIFALISEWPVCHISGLPPARSISSNSTWLALTSAMMVAPGCVAQHVARTGSRGAGRPTGCGPAPSTTPMRSPSPSKAMPRSRLLALHRVLKLHQVLRHGRVRMVGREGAVDRLVQQDVLARQRGVSASMTAPAAPLPASQATVSLRVAPPSIVLQQALDIGVARPVFSRRAVARGDSRPWRPCVAELLDVVAEERRLAEHHLEAVVVRRVVRAGDHHAAVERRGRRTAKYSIGVGPRPIRTTSSPLAARPSTRAASSSGELQPAVIADRDALAAACAPPRCRSRGRSRAHPRGGQRLADDAADVVFAQDGAVELMRLRSCREPAHALRRLT